MGSNDHPDERHDVIMAKMLGHERFLRSVYPHADQREIVIEQLTLFADRLDSEGRTNFRDATLSLIAEMRKDK